MKIVDDNLKTRVDQCVAKCIEIVLGENHNLKIPVSYRTDLKKVAGLAWCYSNIRIELSEQLFLENIEKFFLTTIPHEVAHILTVMLYPEAKQDHGPEWKSVMRILGIEPKRCHNYNILSCYKPGSYFRYSCSCNPHHNLTKIRHKRINLGQVYSCTEL